MLNKYETYFSHDDMHFNNLKIRNSVCLTVFEGFDASQDKKLLTSGVEPKPKGSSCNQY